MTDEKKKNDTRLVPPKKEPKFVPFPEEVQEAQRKLTERISKQSYVEINRLKPDYTHWAKLSSWTCTEMIFLAYGVDPVKGLQGDNYSTGLKHGFVPFPDIEKGLHLTKRAQNDWQLQDRNTPINSILWCDKSQIAVPEELRKLCVEAERHKIDHDEDLNRIADVIREEYQKTSSSEEEGSNEIKTEEEDSDEIKANDNYYRLLSIVLEMHLDESHRMKFYSQADLIDHIESRFKKHEPNRSGISKRALEAVFAEVNRIRPMKVNISEEKPTKK